MSESMAITKFLLARIAEDEGQATAAQRGTNWTRLADSIAAQHYELGWHAFRFSPARVLVECEAKRARLALAGDLEADADDDTYGWAHSVADQIRKVEALPYATHPAYREEWRRD